MASKNANKERDANLVDSLLAELHKYDTLGDSERMVKTSNKIIQASPDLKLGYTCKAVSLILCGKMEEANSLFNKYPQHTMDLKYEKTYCLYRLNKLDEALALMSTETSKQYIELRAQIQFRLDNPKETIRLYEELARSFDSDEYDEERIANLSAALALHNEFDTIYKYAGLLNEESYESCFNKALISINQDNFGETERLLDIAERKCTESMEYDGATPDEIITELTNIKLLIGYVFQKRGRVKEASEVYNDILKMKCSDICLTAVASNNVVVINKDQNVFDSKKKIRTATQEVLITKLPAQYRKFIELNNCLLNYYTNQYERSTSLCQSIAKKWPELAVHTKIIEALNAYKSNKTLDSIDLLMKSNHDPNSDQNLHFKLALAQLSLVAGDKKKACEALENLGVNRYKPGIVGALITIYLHMGQEDVALKVFEDTVEWYKSNKTGGGTDLTNLWKQAADFHLRNGRPTVAANSLKQLLATNPNDNKSIAKLILAFAQFDLKEAVKTVKRLGSIYDIDEEIDLDSLESSSWLAAKRTEKTFHSSPGDGELKKKKHRKHKRKMPKNYDASAAPDPERWLPKYERTGFRKKRDRRNKDIIKGSQGTTSGQSDQFDFTSKIGDNYDESPSSVDPSPAMNKNRSKKNVNQKKKKGGRR